MSPKFLNFKILFIYFLLLIPWPHSHVRKFLCSRDNSRLVRKIVRSKWTPILDKYQVKFPLECPFHPLRDIFAPRQDAKKRDRPTQWTCRLCGKSFYQEKYLDLHFETRHKTVINKVEDSVCLADFCDIMRCDVFQSEESTRLRIGDQQIVTDIEVWSDSLGQSSALAKANAAYLSLIPLRPSALGMTRAGKVQNRALCSNQNSDNKNNINNNNKNSLNNDPKIEIRSDDVIQESKIPSEGSKRKAKNLNMMASSGSPGGSSSSSTMGGSGSGSSSNSESEITPIVVENENVNSNPNNYNDNDSNNKNKDRSKSLPKNQSEELRTNPENTTVKQSEENGNSTSANKGRGNCKPEELSKLKTKCEYLVRSCIGSLILSMTDQSFKEMEEELNKAVCWYLTCDRYWEDGPLEPRAFPWGLIVILVFVLSIGICFCYYIIWILFDSEETTINTNHQAYEYMHQHPTEYHDFPDYITATHGLSAGQPHHYYYQQHQQMHDLYPEQAQYDYRHSPRHYIGDQRQPGTPTANRLTHDGGARTTTPLHHHPSSLAYQQDILDRRDYTNRPIATTAVTSSGSSTTLNANVTNVSTGTPTGSLSRASTLIASDSTNLSGNRYNTHPRQLDSRHRHVGASQQSLRASSSTHEIIQNEVGNNEHYIYVTYPPDLKKRFFEKYE